ncbi:MAG: DNA methylase, partial [Chloroflexi bacterium]|nr:DNA methylase [Chloroflexota bacterium]
VDGGYQYYREMFNARQLLALELSCHAITRIDDDRIKDALATNLSDLLRYQNMLCRYDTGALKSLDVFSVHGFPVSLIQCESNFLGIVDRSQGTNVGSGGWWNITEKYAKAKAYCERPFEVKYEGARKIQVPVEGEWIGDRRNDTGANGHRNVALHCQSATLARIPASSLDAVVTDPPYFGNVQYAELIDFCYVWLRRLVGRTTEAFVSQSTRNINELTGNITMDRGLSHFTEGLSETFCRMSTALKSGAPLIFTYHHNSLDAYYPLAVSILDAGLTCSASIPCPAEMGASIHINGTNSSIIDTIFVCRSTGRVPRRWIAESPKDIAGLVQTDLSNLRAGKVVPTRGDIRCIVYGHLMRLAVWRLRQGWNRARPVDEKLALVASHIRNIGGPSAVEHYLELEILRSPTRQLATLREEEADYGESNDEISF